MSTVSEQERNGQGRCDVGKSVLSGGSRGGVAGVATPSLIFKKQGSITIVAVVISTVSTVSEHSGTERAGQA